MLSFGTFTNPAAAGTSIAAVPSPKFIRSGLSVPELLPFLVPIDKVFDVSVQFMDNHSPAVLTVVKVL